MMNYCPDCGHEVQGTWNNCPNCGRNLKFGEFFSQSSQPQQTILSVNFCVKCGKQLKSHWKVCPYCGHPISRKTHEYFVSSTVLKQPVNKYYPQQKFSTGSSSHVIYPMKEGISKKKLTKSKTAAIILGSLVLVAAILIPVLSINIYNYNHPKKTVQYYVNNGYYSRSYTVAITRSTLDYYENLPHPSHSYSDPFYVASIIESYCTTYEPKIIEIAQAIRSQCVDPDDPEEVINGLLSFTQAITYKSEVKDIAKYPLETIFNRGDCEDMSVLFGSLAEALNYEAILAIIELYDEVEGEWVGHACIGVHLNFVPSAHWSYPPSYYINATEDSNKYWVCETTYQGWMIGEIPVSDPSYFLIAGYAFID
ncbi:MAG: zinc-ribbon domain-containing protein [Promethearchaeota archaeon]